MLNLITKHQFAFAKTRLIINNILVAFEILHYMKNHNSRKIEFMTLKLDISKAYNMVEWVFLEKLVERIGFCSKWIGLIRECLHTISYSILVNGELKGMINPSRGIRQGKPLSPFLFLPCTKCLHRLIKKAARSKEINDFSLCKRGSKLTHLFFANDSLLFCRANSQECENVLKLLSEYVASFGQNINREK